MKIRKVDQAKLLMDKAKFTNPVAQKFVIIDGEKLDDVMSKVELINIKM